MRHNRKLSAFLSGASRRALLPALAVLVLALAGCAETGQMVDQARYDTYETSDFFADGRSVRQPVANTVPYSEDGNPDSPLQTGRSADGQALSGFPVEVDAALLAEGQENYRIYCTPCHGPAGDGTGKAVTFGFPKPPSLVPPANALSNSQMFDVITNGQGTMFSYAYRVKPADRWAVIAYIRAMQLRGAAVDAADLTPDEINQVGAQQ